MHACDVVVVGAGPVGLFAAFQCGLHDLSCAVIEALPQPGGQCAALYPDKPIYDIPGLPSIAAGVLIDNLLRQAAPYAPDYRLGRRAVALHTIEDGFHLHTDRDETFACKAVIVAAGNGAIVPQRPPLPGLVAAEAENRVLYALSDAQSLRGKRVVVAGGGDSALDRALQLCDIAQVTLVHRRPVFRAAPATLLALEAASRAGRIALCVPAQLHDIDAHGVIVRDDAGALTALPADVLLPCFGQASALGSLESWTTRTERGFLVDPATSATARSGLYAVGDAAAHPHKLRLILTGFAEAAAAVHHAYPRITGRALHHVHSTQKCAPTARAAE